MANGKSKKKKKVIIFSIIGVLLLSLIIIAFVGGSKDEIVAVQVEEAQKRDITQTVTAIGKINPEFKVIITPEVTGEIVTLHHSGESPSPRLPANGDHLADDK